VQVALAARSGRHVNGPPLELLLLLEPEPLELLEPEPLELLEPEPLELLEPVAVLPLGVPVSVPLAVPSSSELFLGSEEHAAKSAATPARVKVIVIARVFRRAIAVSVLPKLRSGPFDPGKRRYQKASSRGY
jgi:hypothetical protein